MFYVKAVKSHSFFDTLLHPSYTFAQILAWMHPFGGIMGTFHREVPVLYSHLFNPSAMRHSLHPIRLSLFLSLLMFGAMDEGKAFGFDS